MALLFLSNTRSIGVLYLNRVDKMNTHFTTRVQQTSVWLSIWLQNTISTIYSLFKRTLVLHSPSVCPYIVKISSWRHCYHAFLANPPPFTLSHVPMLSVCLLVCLVPEHDSRTVLSLVRRHRHRRLLPSSVYNSVSLRISISQVKLSWVELSFSWVEA